MFIAHHLCRRTIHLISVQGALHVQLNVSRIAGQDPLHVQLSKAYSHVEFEQKRLAGAGLVQLSGKISVDKIGPRWNSDQGKVMKWQSERQGKAVSQFKEGSLK